ncbi:MAG: DUF1592 domain-containing protein [Planctomycetales bacterium]|nr:DUF1592 domain-containing protein [Planctomycetales bacterium]
MPRVKSRATCHVVIVLLFACKSAAAQGVWTFEKHVSPFLNKHCTRCHGAEEMESGIRLDLLDGELRGRRQFLWKTIGKLVAEEKMPPEDEPQPTADERKSLARWIDAAIEKALLRDKERNGSARRLTVAQYRNTLEDLLGLREDLTGVLPADGVSKDGFVNNGQTLLLSPLLVEAYFDIAQKALDLSIVDENTKPVIQHFRMQLGKSINPDPFPDQLILGANSHLLDNADHIVSEPRPDKPFDFKHFHMQTKFRFIEGYQGNDTVRGWRQYDSIYHAVFACMRGSEGYPKGLAYQTVPEGLILRPAIPSREQFGVESTYGPRANFKISLRELPDHGNFRVTVRAAKYNDAMLLDQHSHTRAEPTGGGVITIKSQAEPQNIEITRAGIYQADVYLAGAQALGIAPPSDENRKLTLTLNDRVFSGDRNQDAFLVVRLPTGPMQITTKYEGSVAIDRVVLTPLDETDSLAQKFATFEKRLPRLGVHVGLRRDCGSTMSPVGRPQTVTTEEIAEYIFEGAINNYPSPNVENNNVNYLAGVREIGVRSEFTDGRDVPRLLIQSIDFEGPFYKSWPPASHRRIFIDSPDRDTRPVYARQVIRNFATKAFRRPITAGEEAAIIDVWQQSFAESNDFNQSIKDALLVVLTSPQFLFLIENSTTPDAEDLDAFELASKLSYFLWNSSPDERLLKLAADGTLHESLDSEIERMIADPRFEQFTHEFVSQWLSLDKFDVVSVDRKQFPKLTRDTKAQLREEPIRFVQHLMRENLPLQNLIKSDFILANDVVANYYRLGHRVETGFDFVPLKHDNKHLGGVLSQASILAGLSDGRHSHPIKRGAWFARKMIARPPADPPPNVPELVKDDGSLTLRDKLALHRDAKGCANCHAGIDPWGFPFEGFNAGGLYENDPKIDATSRLPDGTEIAGLNDLKNYLAKDNIDRVAFSFMKHLATYAVGRDLTYHEVVFLEEDGLQLKPQGYRIQDIIRFVVNSDMFLKK